MEEKKSRLNFDRVKVDKDQDFYRIMFSGQVGLQLNYLDPITEDMFAVKQIQHSRKRLVLAVKLRGGRVLIWECSAATGADQLTGTEGTVTIIYLRVLEEQ